MSTSPYSAYVQHDQYIANIQKLLIKNMNTTNDFLLDIKTYAKRFVWAKYGGVHL